MWRLITVVSSVLTTLVGLNACNSAPDESDYFPLDKGLNWQYRYQVISPDQQIQGIYSVANLTTATVKGEAARVRRTNEGRDYYLVRKPDGIYRYASRTLLQTYPVTDEPARLVLPRPYLDSAERRWSSTTTSYVIHRVGPSTMVNANPTKDFVMHYRVAAKDETVVVPAGTFKHCLLVEGEAKLTIFADPLTGYTEVPVTTREWYAPGVGLVKLERTEPLNTSVYKGGVYLFELIGR